MSNQRMQQQQDKKKRNKAIMWAVTSLMIMTYLALIFQLAKYSVRVFQPKIIRPTLTELAYWTGIRFPQGSKLIESYGESGLEYIILAKLDTPREKTSELLSSLPRCREKQESRTIMPFELVERSIANVPAWWNPRSIKKFNAITAAWPYEKPRWTQLYLLISYDDENHATIFIYVHVS